MQDYIKNVRKNFTLLKKSLLDLYEINKLNPSHSLTIREHIYKIEKLIKSFEEWIPSHIKSILDENTSFEKLPAKVEIILQSKKGQRQEHKGICNSCHMSKNPIYKYSKSNVGVVFLCNPCKTKVFERSFGSLTLKRDNLIGKNIYSGGAWETNRQRH